MDQAVNAFDILVYCKAYERDDYAALGKPLIYMPLGYCDQVLAVGALREYLPHVLAAAGIDLKIWGGYWEFLCDGKWSPRRQFILKQLAGRDRFRLHRDEILADAWQGGELYADDLCARLDGRRRTQRQFRVIDRFWRTAAGRRGTARLARLRYGGLKMPCDLTDMLQQQCYFFGT
jgi:hypothetical protein